MLTEVSSLSEAIDECLQKIQADPPLIGRAGRPQVGSWPVSPWVRHPGPISILGMQITTYGEGMPKHKSHIKKQ